MATKEQINNFIDVISVLARNEYMSREKWILPSVCIAQAALESGWNLNAKTLFGIKGKGFTASTTEYYNGNKVQIEATFRQYPDVASAVVGYYDFLAETPRYAKALNNPDCEDTVYYLIHTLDGAPYATDPNYISKIVSIIDTYDLTQYDEREEVRPIPAHRFNVGDMVSYDKIYISANSTKPLEPMITRGRITKVLEGVKHPYLINENTGWVDDEVIITEKQPEPAENPNTIKKGDKVRVLEPIHYDTGRRFALYYSVYDVIEVKGNRVVIGIDKVVTAPVHVDNLKLV